MTEPSQLRISDDDRHKVADLLRDAAGDGRLEPDELDERLEATYSARIYADLVPLLSDLPVEAPQPAGLAVPSASNPVSFTQPADSGGPATRYDNSFSFMGGVDRSGHWEIGPEHTVVALMGGANIDLRQARFAEREIVINAYAFMGGVEITVNAWTRAIVDGIGIAGGFAQGRDRVDPTIDANSPVVRIKGVALMGGVNVTRTRMPGEKKRKRRNKG